MDPDVLELDWHQWMGPDHRVIDVDDGWIVVYDSRSDCEWYVAPVSRMPEYGREPLPPVSDGRWIPMQYDGVYHEIYGIWHD